MENKIELETERWVEERMALLAAPEDWEPDAGVARTRFEGRRSARRATMRRGWLPRAAAVALACLVLLLVIPTTRALTQQLWEWLTLRKVEVVQADFQRLRGIWLFPQIIIMEAEEHVPPDGELPSQDHGISEPGPDLDLTEAAERAGFWPRLPDEGVPPDRLMTMDPMVWSATLKASDLELSLRQAGVDDQPIPKEWDGAQLSMRIGSAIFADWREAGLGIMQHPPITFSAPAGFDFLAYWTAALRAAGVNRDRARQVADRIATTPTLLLGIAKNGLEMREVKLHTGPATLIEHTGKSGRVESVILIWSDADRVYHLDARSEDQAISAANSIPEHDVPVVVPESAAAGENAGGVVPEFRAGGGFPAGSYEMFVGNEKAILTFTADGRIIGKKVDGGRIIGGLYSTNGDEIVMKEMKGERGDIEKECAGPGKYKWRFDGKALRFTKVADDCYGRARSLTGNLLALVVERKGVKNALKLRRIRRTGT
jgi:hypothetical protein